MPTEPRVSDPTSCTRLSMVGESIEKLCRWCQKSVDWPLGSIFVPICDGDCYLIDVVSRWSNVLRLPRPTADEEKKADVG